jgi:hypothetical protein
VLKAVCNLQSLLKVLWGVNQQGDTVSDDTMELAVILTYDFIQKLPTVQPKKKKYRPYTHKVVGQLRGELVTRAFKNQASAEKFAATLYKPVMWSLI